MEIFKSLRILSDKWLTIYRSVPRVEDSAGVCSKSSWVTETFLGIRASVMAIISKLIVADCSRFWSSSKILFDEQELRWKFRYRLS